MGSSWRLLAGLLTASCLSCLVKAGPLDLQLLHASDFEGGVATLKEIPRFSQVLEALKSEYASNTVVLSSGDDYIYGPFFMASADESMPFHGVKGRADIVILNGLGVQAAVFGNHEFDGGSEIIQKLLVGDPRIGYPGTLFPYLAANLIFTNDANLGPLVVPEGQDWRVATNRIAASTVITVRGEQVGIVGVTTPELPRISHPGDVMVADDTVVAVQQSVDRLYDRGIKKIVLLTHLQQLANEEKLAGRLTNVSVIVAGGSHEILANPNDRLREGDKSVGDYPLVVRDAAGKNVYIVNVQNGYRYVGRLLVHFDSNDVVTAISPKSGAYAADDLGVKATRSFPANTNIVSIIRSLQRVIFTKDGRIFGRVDAYLEGLSGEVRTKETNLGDLVADAFLYRAKLTDSNVCLAIINGGGIRDSIGCFVDNMAGTENRPALANPGVGKMEGDISQLDIENSLRFNDVLALLSITAQQLRDALEWGLGCSSPCGRFPQVSGLALSFNVTNTPMSYAWSNGVVVGITNPGNRLQSLVVSLPNGKGDVVVENGILVGDPSRKYRIVTTVFLANGGDTYYPLTFGTDRVDLVPPGTTKTFMTDGAEQRALADYIASTTNCLTSDYAKSWGRRIVNLSHPNQSK